MFSPFSKKNKKKDSCDIISATDEHGNFLGFEDENLLPEHQELDFSPNDIKFVSRAYTLNELLERFSNNLIKLNPDFQRKSSVWSKDIKSRFIESLLLGLPLPIFFFQTDVSGKWIVVDGLQRITTLIEFVLYGRLFDKKIFSLSGLELLKNMEGKTFSELTRPAQSVILNTTIQIHILQPNTPEPVTELIYRRINTRSINLSGQDIRHAAYRGESTILLDTLVEDDLFAELIGIKHKKSVKRYGEEMILRFFSFWLIRKNIEKYKEYNGLDNFLSASMIKINKMDITNIHNMKKTFKIGLGRNKEVFGNLSFRKQYEEDRRINPINKALFETWMVALSDISEKDFSTKILPMRNDIVNIFKESLIENYHTPDITKKSKSLSVSYLSSISTGTNSYSKVKFRFFIANNILSNIIKRKP